jgi:hypothetical protein
MRFHSGVPLPATTVSARVIVLSKTISRTAGSLVRERMLALLVVTATPLISQRDFFLFRQEVGETTPA